MKVSYVESLASYFGSESCVHIRKGVGEALTGVRVGRVLSRVIHAPWRKLRVVRGAEAVEISRRSHRGCRFGKAAPDPARSQTPCMHASTLLGNREVPGSSATLSAEDPETARFPSKVLGCMHGVCDRAGSGAALPKRQPRCGLRLISTASAPRTTRAFRHGACITRAQYPARAYLCQRFAHPLTRVHA